jgi:hypothetical protein
LRVDAANLLSASWHVAEELTALARASGRTLELSAAPASFARDLTRAAAAGGVALRLMPPARAEAAQEKGPQGPAQAAPASLAQRLDSFLSTEAARARLEVFTASRSDVALVEPGRSLDEALRLSQARVLAVASPEGFDLLARA